jgi:hypothetical protein
LRGDVSLSSSGALSVHLRWTKTLQRYNQSARFLLFPVPHSILCPVRAFLNLQSSFPVRPSDPFLSYRVAGRLHIISQADLRLILKRLISALGLHPSLSFHSFRRSAASLAHSSGLSFQQIQTHGTWTSDALLAYLDAGARDPAVPRFFSSFFSSF